MEEEDISLTPRIVRLSWILFLRPIIAACIYIAGVRGRRKERGVKIREMWERYDILFFPFSFF